MSPRKPGCELKELKMNEGAEYLYFIDIDVPMFVQYNNVEQILPGVATSITKEV